MTSDVSVSVARGSLRGIEVIFQTRLKERYDPIGQQISPEREPRRALAQCVGLIDVLRQVVVCGRKVVQMETHRPRVELRH